MVRAEPEIKESVIQLKIGPVLAAVPKYPEYKYGDVLKVKGNIEYPPELEGFSYANYLKTQGIYFVVYNPEIELKTRDPGPGFYSRVLDFKEKVRGTIDSAMPSPESAIMAASLMGGERGISKNLQSKLNTAGVRHIIAVSGMNIVIISNLLMLAFLKLGIKKKWSICLSLFFIFLFLALCAFQISAVRAGIMGSLALAGPLLGRRSNGARAIVIAGLAMLAVNPYLLLYDAGFQLSFLASFGMIYLSQPIKRILKSEIISTTLSAYIFTFPILIYSFGQISIFGIAANAFILPVVPAIMVLGLIATIIGIILPFLSWLLFLIPYFLIRYLLYIVDIFSKPWMAFIFQEMHIFWFIAYYILLGIFANYIYKKERSLPFFLR